ncbi:MAG: hypothetical protein FWC27_07940, partial [Firmicutes bacterium]|nr:hypothetical protein [Bacillota bacterium]
MPKKTIDPADQPLEQAASPPIIGETDVERRLDEELAKLEARTSPQTETEPPGDWPEGAEGSSPLPQTEAEPVAVLPESPPLRPRRRKAAAVVEGDEKNSQSGDGEPEDPPAPQTETPPPA